MAGRLGEGRQAIDNATVFAALLPRFQAEDACRWLGTPNPDLNGRTPEALLAERQWQRVLKAIERTKGNTP